MFRHKFIPLWDQHEKDFYCQVCGVLKKEHGLFEDWAKYTDDELDARWKEGLSVPFHFGMELTVTLGIGLPPTKTIRVRNGKPKTQD